jgi:methionine aminopeptidase
MCFSLSATSSMATSFSCSAGSSKSSLGGLAHGVSGSSIFILACVRRTDGSWTAQFEHTLLITDTGVDILTAYE